MKGEWLGMNLEEAEKVLNEIGVNIKDNEGNYRNFLEVLQDLGTKFEMLNEKYKEKVYESLGM